AHAVDDVKIGFQLLPGHPNRIKHADLPDHVIMLNDRMQKSVLRRDAHLARVTFHVFDILLINLIAVFRQHDATAIVEALKMRAGDSHVNTPNHDVAFLFGIDYCLVHAFHCGFEINDLALAHAARRRLADSQDFDCAVGPAFADDDTDFGCANLKADHQIITCHGC